MLSGPFYFNNSPNVPWKLRRFPFTTEWLKWAKKSIILVDYSFHSHLNINASSLLMNYVNFYLQFGVAIFIILISFLELKSSIPNCSLFLLLIKTDVSCSRKSNYMWSTIKIENRNDLIRFCVSKYFTAHSLSIKY